MLSANQIPPSTYAKEPEFTDAEEATLNEAKDPAAPSPTLPSISAQLSLSASDSSSAAEVSSFLGSVSHDNQPAGGEAIPSPQPARLETPKSVVMNAQGNVRPESEGYTLQPGEARVHSSSEDVLRSNELEMRKALDPNGEQMEAQKNPDVKFGFPSSHFEHGASGDNSTAAARLGSMMPYPLGESESLHRLTSEKDPGKDGKDSDKVSADKMLESAAALQYATDKGYDPTLIGRHSATVDFHLKDVEGQVTDKFDPFTSPQPKPSKPLPAVQQQKINDLRQQRPELLTKKNDLLEKQKKMKGEGKQLDPHDKQALNKVTNDLKTSNIGLNQYSVSTEQWAKSTYTSHTNQSKGDGVTGVWDQTSTRADQMDKLKDSIDGRDKTEFPRDSENVSQVDLNLARAYTVEDDLARQQIARRNLNSVPQNSVPPKNEEA
jgi:hypothetical protein